MSAPTAKQLAAGQGRTLRAMREKLLNMAAQWDGVVEYNRTRLGELSDLVDEIGGELVPDEKASQEASKFGVDHG